MAAEGFSSDQAIRRKPLGLAFGSNNGGSAMEVTSTGSFMGGPTRPPVSLPLGIPALAVHGPNPGAEGPAVPPCSLPISPDSPMQQTVHSHGQLASMGHPTQIERRLRSHSLEAAGKLQISPGQVYDFTADDLQDQGEIGRGAYGTVNKMYHEQSATTMAVKRIRSTVDEKEQKQLLMDLDVVMRSNECNFIVQFFGALFKEGDCWICMELMSISLDKFYKFTCIHMAESIPEEILGKITVATVKALNYLKEKLKIIHRDVKPSNILLDSTGDIKLCDFGISGQLVDSIAKTRDAGCRPYMAPERIDPRNSSKGYDVRSDVWSLGITLTEVATGKFPYPKWNSVFDQLTQVVQGEPPQLRDNDQRFSVEFKDFCNTCLIKEYEQRPKYNKLLKHDFIRRYENTAVDVAGYVQHILDIMPADRSQLMDSSNS